MSLPNQTALNSKDLICLNLAPQAAHPVGLAIPLGMMQVDKDIGSLQTKDATHFGKVNVVPNDQTNSAYRRVEDGKLVAPTPLPLILDRTEMCSPLLAQNLAVRPKQIGHIGKASILTSHQRTAKGQVQLILPRQIRPNPLVHSDKRGTLSLIALRQRFVSGRLDVINPVYVRCRWPQHPQQGHPKILRQSDKFSSLSSCIFQKTCQMQTEIILRCSPECFQLDRRSHDLSQHVPLALCPESVCLFLMESGDISLHTHQSLSVQRISPCAQGCNDNTDQGNNRDKKAQP